MNYAFSILTLLFLNVGFAQENSKLVFPKEPKMSDAFLKSIDEQKIETDRIFRDRSEKIKNYTTEFILDKIDNSKEYQYVFEAEYWIAYKYNEIIPELIQRITNKKEIGLVNTADLIIDERIQSGDLKFYGHGGVAFDDLFTLAGRANHLLTIITGEDFGHVSMYSTDTELKQLQNSWSNWLKQL